MKEMATSWREMYCVSEEKRPSEFMRYEVAEEVMGWVFVSVNAHHARLIWQKDQGTYEGTPDLWQVMYRMKQLAGPMKDGSDLWRTFVKFLDFVPGNPPETALWGMMIDPDVVLKAALQAVRACK